MIWTILTGNPIARALAKIGGLVLLIVTFGAWQRRQGAKTVEQKQAVATAKAHQETIEEVLHETPSNDPADVIRGRMRKRAGKS